LLNCAKATIVSAVVLTLFLFISKNLFSDDFNEVLYSNAKCFETTFFAECKFNNGNIIIGGKNINKNWHGNVKLVFESKTAYRFFKDGEVRYGVEYFNNGYYVGDLTSDAYFYGLGTFYFDSGSKASYQNWHEDKRIGYFHSANGKRETGRFDTDHNLIIPLTLNKDFQLKLNNMELLARSVEVDFKNEYQEFLKKKRIFISSSSNSNKSSVLNSTDENSSQTSSTNYVSGKKESSSYNLNLIIGLGILFIFIVIILWKKASPSKITQADTKESQSRKDSQEEIERYKNLSLADSRKLFSYGVKEFMSVPEACRQLRSEYFKWTTVSNNPDGLKKSLSQKNKNNIIRLRKKLEC